MIGLLGSSLKQCHYICYNDCCQEAYLSALWRFPPLPGTPSIHEVCTTVIPSGFPLRSLWCTVLEKGCKATAPLPSRHKEMSSPLSATQARKPDGAGTARETLTITDNRTGKSYEIPITTGTIRA